MTLDEEIALLKEKRDLLIEIKALEEGHTTRLTFPNYPIYPNYPYWPFWRDHTGNPPPVTYTDTSDQVIWDTGNEAQMPSRLEGLDPLIQDGLRQPCTFS